MKVGHNIKYDLQMFSGYGVDIAPVDDTMLMSYILHGTTHGHGMDELVQLYCNHTTIAFEDVAGKGKNQVTFDRVPIDKALTYAAEDAEVTLRMHKLFKPRLPHEQVTAVYEDVERPVIPVLATMERTGVRVDPGVLQSMSHEFGQRLVGLEAAIHRLAGHPFNVGSPKQLGAVLFGEMGIPGGRKTKTGEWSTAVDVLEDLGEKGYEIVDKVLEHRQLSKLKSTYTDALQTQVVPATGRVHTSYQMAGTSTGRLASTDPNLQNIPIRTEEGRKIRTAFVAEPGWTILSADYSQVELRLAAEMANVAALKQAFRDKVDIHSLTASQVFDVPLDRMTPDLRRAAKAVNFGIIYGISGWGLSKQLGISANDATTYIRRYLARFPEIQTYMEACKDEAREHGYVKTLFGRKCFINNINNKMPGLRAGAERQAINAPLQGTAADIMKLAMGRMPAALHKADLRARMLLQVHDELVFEVPQEEIETTAATVRAVMENVVSLDVPLEAEAGWGPNWGAAH
jgi:DNA polymerase-1